MLNNVNGPLSPTPFNQGLSYMGQSEGTGCLGVQGAWGRGKDPGLDSEMERAIRSHGVP